MLLSTVEGLKALQDNFNQFIMSGETSIDFLAKTIGNPEPYEKFLMGMRVEKCRSKAALNVTSDDWLYIQGSTDDLTNLTSELLVKSDGDHNHWYCKPISLIIEADSSWQG